METLFNSFYLGNISEENNIYILKKKNGCYRILGIQNAVLFGVCLQNFELD